MQEHDTDEILCLHLATAEGSSGPDGSAVTTAELLDSLDVEPFLPVTLSYPDRPESSGTLDIYEETGERVKRSRYLGILGAIEVSTGAEAAGREKRRNALSALADVDSPLAELTVVRYHVETELASGNRDRARELCSRAQSILDGTDATIGRERNLVVDLCERVEQ